MNTLLKYQSITVPLPSTDQLHITRFYRDKKNLGTPVFLLHSILQDGGTFYTQEGNGLACYLAREGYDVYVADMRGKGKSWPAVNDRSSYGTHQAINEDIPAIIKKIINCRGDIPQIWIGHGWGSVLLCSYFARYGNTLCSVDRMVHFAARRKMQEATASKQFVFDFLWRRLSLMLIAAQGYMPAKLLRMGTSNESLGNYQDYLSWSANNDWLDTADGFNYGEAIVQQQLPPSYYFAASGDKIYGDPAEVRQFIKELGPHDSRLMVLSRQGGNLRDYSHLGMVRQKLSDEDHFPLLLDWLRHT